MILSLLKYIRGFLKISIVGNDLERFMNLCSQKDILLWNISLSEGTCQCNVSVYGFFMLKQICRKTKTKVIILERTGIPFFFHRYRKRKLFFLCFGLAIVLLKFTSGFLWKIQIEGNTAIDSDEIIAFLAGEQCAIGSKISRINPEELEDNIRENFPEIIWTSIDISGTCVTVFVKENLLVDDVNSIPEDEMEGFDLVANKTGIIRELVTRNGTPVKKVGDQVNPQDVIILGQVPLKDESQMVTSSIMCQADGDVMISSVDVFKKSFPMKYEQKNYTQKPFHFYYMQGQFTRNPFFYSLFKKEQCDLLIYKEQFCVWDSFYLPIYLCHLVKNDYTVTKETYTNQEAKEKAYDYFSQYIDKLQQKGIQITGKNVMITTKDGVCTIKGEIDTLEKVTTYLPTNPHILDISKGQNEQ